MRVLGTPFPRITRRNGRQMLITKTMFLFLLGVALLAIGGESLREWIFTPPVDAASNPTLWSMGHQVLNILVYLGGGALFLYVSIFRSDVLVQQTDDVVEQESEEQESEEREVPRVEAHGVSVPESLLQEMKEANHSDEVLINIASDYDNFESSASAMLILADPDRGDAELIGLVLTEHTPVIWDQLAMRAILIRDPSITLSECLKLFPWPSDEGIRQIIGELLDVLYRRSPPETEAKIVAEWIQSWDADSGPALTMLATFLDDDFLRELSDQMNEGKESTLNSVTSPWTTDEIEKHQKECIELPGFKEYKDGILKRLEEDAPRSLLLVGPRGSGKETLIRKILADLAADGWSIVEASAQELVAGMMYVGQLEERWTGLVNQLSAKKTILFIPDFIEMESAGRHMNNPVSLLDRMIIEIRKKRLITVGIVEGAEIETLLRKNRAIRTAFDLVEVKAPGIDETVEGLKVLVRQHCNYKDTKIEVTDEILKKIVTLSQQYLTSQAVFGSSFDLFKSIMERKRQAGESKIVYSDAVSAITERSGMPSVIVDDEEMLDPGQVMSFFRQRIIGQDEAIQCMADRITLLKAGLTDPGRPLGVFFFAGPTGTGKTESAKVLAEYLFGSKERLERIDMSELQTAGDLGRLVGSPDDGHHGSHHSLLDAIRRQPFCVVLLDEFEKAHPQVWDMFLQAFDDARMTDTRGQTVDLRHVVFIMTSNVGAREAAQGAFGFNPDSGKENLYERALRETFRPEFLNRIDHVVTFRPFSRSEQRALLEMELKRVLSRRGLRDRPWAVEWEESAIDFLLSRGLTSQLGARPLRRAVEKHALTPIAHEMLLHDIPKEDQFLFVRSNGEKIEVDFVDPDVPDPEEQEAELSPVDITSGDLRVGAEAVARVALRGSGRLEEVLILADRVEELEGRIESASWKSAKKEDLERMSAADFWNSSDRLPVLASSELRDRIDSGTCTARSLLDRLGGDAENSRDRYPPELIRRLAMQIHLLKSALQVLDDELPQDAFIRIRPIQRDRESPKDGAQWSQQVVEMVKTWAKKRNMTLIEFDISSAVEEPEGSWMAAVTGFAAYSLLEPLAGIHELERPEESRNDRRLHARIDVVPRPLGQSPAGESGVYQQARELMKADSKIGEVVRRYRVGENPKLVDLRQGWRCASPEDALAGDFDLVGSLAALSR